MKTIKDDINIAKERLKEAVEDLRQFKEEQGKRERVLNRREEDVGSDDCEMGGPVDIFTKTKRRR
ncbi:6719_t:CDS:2 [Funneliformis mosseae]|uniref:6719_t:CDS:1 n=1 Tax=Funneliformis mosseae TaxID=27381 RepID=A0A9N9GWI8_FUNMO|nr:6719_t:CDS:2 [Funneliformis mosseae]